MSKPVNRILFIDDDKYFARIYLEKLSAHFAVDYRQDVEGALAAFQSATPYVATVVDAMMPPPEGCEMETSHGASTGIWLIKKVQKEIEERNIAVVIFTNLGAEAVIEECKRLQLPTDRLTVTSKYAVPSDMLPYLVQHAISRAHSEEGVS